MFVLNALANIVTVRCSDTEGMASSDQEPRPNYLYRVAAVAVVASLGLVGCGTGGWSSSDKQEFRARGCVELLGIGANSYDCTCILNAVIAAYPDVEDWYGQTGRSSEFVQGVRACGWGWQD